MQCTSLVKPLSLTNGFAAHKYLLIAIVERLQKKYASRSIPSPEQRSDPAVHRWMREPSAQREHTPPCIVTREHHDRGDLSVAQVALEHKSEELPSLVEWMRQRVPASRYPDQDTLHLALATTLPVRPCRLSDRTIESCLSLKGKTRVSKPQKSGADQPWFLRIRTGPGVRLRGLVAQGLSDRISSAIARASASLTLGCGGIMSSPHTPLPPARILVASSATAPALPP